MKRLLLCFLIFLSLYSFAQNQAPIAVNDTISFTWDEVNYGNLSDTVEQIIYTNSLLQNDSDPDGNSITVISMSMMSSNSISFASGGNFVFFFNYRNIQPFSGKDTLQYIISDNQFPAKYDTAYVFISVGNPIHEYLTANNIKARVDIYSLFGATSKSGFEAPKGHGTHSIFEANLWMSAVHNNTPVSSSRKFFWDQGQYNPSNSGPISDFSGTISMTNNKWERVWKVSQSQIDWHLDHYTNSGYTVPSEIANWPAHGDIRDGEAQFLAPYYDRNSDNFYDPMDGDYPIIKGDQAIYFIYNDEISMSGLNTMKTEIHVMAYAFQCPDSAIQNTVFVDYKIYNRSQNTYDSTSFGMWSDFDLGNPLDDYVQCDVMRNLFYAFNGDDFDDDNGGLPGYGSHPGSQGVVLLKGPKQDDDGIDNNIDVFVNESVNGTGFGDGITDNEYWGLNRFIYFNNGLGLNSDPRTDLDFYNYFSGRWKDGTHMVHGGNGHINSPSATNIPTSFMLPGDSDPLNFGTQGVQTTIWNEMTAGNIPSDRRGVGVTGPITFHPGDMVELTYAFVFGRDYVNQGAQAGVDNMITRVDSIQSYYNKGLLSPCGDPLNVKNVNEVADNIHLYPNPAKTFLQVELKSSASYDISIYDITGKLIKQQRASGSETSLYVGDIIPGTYILHAKSEQKVFRKVVVIE